MGTLLICYGAAVLFAVTVSADLHVQPACPEGFDITCDMTCYKIIRNAKKDWFGAKSACEKMEGKLASIRDEEEQTCLVNAHSNSSDYDQLWIGLYTNLQTDPITDPNQYRWLDATAPTGKSSYKNWAISGDYREPNDPQNAGIERCVEMRYDSYYFIEVNAPMLRAVGLWNNMPCATERDYICEKKRERPIASGVKSSPDTMSDDSQNAISKN